ncbi:MAG: MFS transporter [Alphaproteobacteria bacterium]|nr:MFS transporter [Alphaproteobacteria bacterium]
MSQLSRAIDTTHDALTVARRSVVIGLIAFLTVVDLFATQAILPTLARAYQVTPAAMGFAVNASTIGMAIAGLSVALLDRHIDRRRGILASLVLLSLPTALLAIAPNLGVFTALRIAQGLCMATAFSLTLAFLGEECSAMDAGGAVAAYITGNVASNLVGRLISAGVADHLGLAANFYFFATLNLAGAALVYCGIHGTTPVPMVEHQQTGQGTGWLAHFRDAPLRASFGIGFCILFAFIGTFTYVNFVLVRAPLLLGQMSLGLVYLVFLPAIVTTLCAGRAVAILGVRPAFCVAIAIAGAGLPLLLTENLVAMLTGLALVGVGTFFAQAVATGFIGRAAKEHKGAASGIYLACYFAGGLAGTAILGQIFDRVGWGACVAGIAAALATAAVLASRLTLAPNGDRP